jgi:hypothetical protein
MLTCPDDDSFGPVLEPSSNYAVLDFTLLFEDVIFYLVPSLVVLLVILFALSRIWHMERALDWSLVSVC